MKSFYYILLFLGMPFWLLAQTTGQNYIVTTVPIAPVSGPTTLTDANSGSNSNTTIQYFDGLGRPMETVQKAITPSSNDLVGLTEYDSFGREFRHWLPITNAGSGAFVDPATFANNQTTLYNGDAKPYATTDFEPSPLNRVTGKYGEGASWYAAQKNDSILYQADAGEVAYFFVNSSNQLQRQGNYTAGSLYKTIVTDEDGKSSTEYKDKLGQVVMKQSSTDAVNTYYVYNDLEQLSYVLPPIATDSLPSGVISDDNGVLKRYAYLYKYDERGNNVVKRLPGCDSICMVYDIAQRMIMSQDGNQRVKNNWIVTKYDAFGRVIYTGLLNTTSTRVQLKATYYNTVVVENYTNGTGYSCTDFCSATPLTVNFYDSYDYLVLSTVTAADKATLPFVTLSGYDGQYSSAKGLLTGTRIYILDKVINTGLTTALYYDKYGRVVQTRASNHLDGYDITYNHYDFTGKVLTARKEHNISGQTVIPEVYRYTYDKAERLINTRYKLATSDTITLASNTYDELGRLITNYRHNQTDTVSYTYNIRNWVSNISSGAFKEQIYYNVLNGLPATPCYNGNISCATYSNNGSRYLYNYDYDGLNRLTQTVAFPYSVQTGIVMTNFAMYPEIFSYDKQGNIIHLTRVMTQTCIDYLTMSYTGNQVKSITDACGSQNQASVKEYQNGVNLATEFYFDKNGNMTTDLDRKIASIRYNILNLPDTIQFSTGNQIINRYAADGRKLGTEYFTRVTNLVVPLITGQVINQTYTINAINQNGTAYIDNMEYNTFNGNSTLTALQRIYNSEGFADTITATIPNYKYYRLDHLGNNREVWLANTKTTIQRTQYYPSGLPWASNTGDNPGVQERKYNGKEFVEMNGYDGYDYGARTYFPDRDGWPTVDPLAEKYYSISPYAYCKGDPINYIDHDGRFSQEWMANLSRGWYNLWHKEKAGKIIENKDATKSQFKYTYQTSENIKGEANVTSHYKFSKDAAQNMQNVGDAAALTGLGLTVSVVGAEAGVPLAAAGGIFSGVGSAWEMGIDYLNGDLSNVNKKLAFYISGKLIEKSLNKVLPGGGKTLYQDGFDLGTEIIKQGTALKVTGIERAVDAKINNNTLKKKENK
jgi:RHS repeat-associated protein